MAEEKETVDSIGVDADGRSMGGGGSMVMEVELVGAEEISVANGIGEDRLSEFVIDFMLHCRIRLSAFALISSLCLFRKP